MRYKEDMRENEIKAEEMGERNIMTRYEYECWASDEHPYGEALETLLDIANGIYPLEDFIKEVKEYNKG